MILPRIISTGIFAFAVRIISVFTGLAYVTLLTRRLAFDAAASIAMYGYWSQIQSLLLYPTLISAPIPFWATREVARGGKVVGTALTGSLVLSIPGALLYLPSAAVAGPSAVSTAFYLAALILPVSMVAQALDGVARGIEPRRSLYGLLAFEIGKVVATYLLLVSIPLSLTGAILAMVAARLIQSIILASTVSTIDRPSYGTLKRWYKTGWLPISYQLALLLSALDQAIIPIIFGRPEPTAYFNAAQSAASPVSYSAWLSFALYPVLLAGGGASEIKSAGRLTMLFGVPMLLGAIFYAPSILGLLRPEYAPATLALSLLAVVMFLNALDVLLDSVITGVERRDTTEGRVRGTLLYTSLKIRLGSTSTNFLTSTLLAIYAAVARLDILYFVALWAMVHVATSVGSTMINLYIAKKYAQMPLVTLNPTKYLIASAPMLLFLVWVGQVQQASFTQYLLSLGTKIAIGGILYFTALIAVDNVFRRWIIRLIRSAV